jgi:hypothetical protein
MDDIVDTIKIEIPNRRRDDQDGRRRDGNDDVVTYCTVDNLVQLKDKNGVVVIEFTSICIDFTEADPKDTGQYILTSRLWGTQKYQRFVPPPTQDGTETYNDLYFAITFYEKGTGAALLQNQPIGVWYRECGKDIPVQVQSDNVMRAPILSRADQNGILTLTWYRTSRDVVCPGPFPP